MALTSDGWWLSIRLIDGGRDKTTKQYQMRAATAAEAVADAAIVAAALEAITDAEILEYSYREKFTEKTVAVPAATVHVENQASITCMLGTGGGKMANFKVPAPKLGIFSGDTGKDRNIVDINDGDLNTYFNIFQSDGEVFISDGEDGVEMVEGTRIHVKSSSG